MFKCILKLNDFENFLVENPHFWEFIGARSNTHLTCEIIETKRFQITACSRRIRRIRVISSWFKNLFQIQPIIGGHALDCNTWPWIKPHYTVTLHMLNHMKLLQPNVVQPKIKCYSLMCDISHSQNYTVWFIHESYFD